MLDSRKNKHIEVFSDRYLWLLEQDDFKLQILIEKSESDKFTCSETKEKLWEKIKKRGKSPYRISVYEAHYDLNGIENCCVMSYRAFYKQPKHLRGKYDLIKVGEYFINKATGEIWHEKHDRTYFLRKRECVRS